MTRPTRTRERGTRAYRLRCRSRNGRRRGPWFGYLMDELYAQAPRAHGPTLDAPLSPSPRLRGGTFVGQVGSAWVVGGGVATAVAFDDD